MILTFSGAEAVTKTTLIPNELCKIYIDEDGIYRIEYLDLVDAGCNLNQINPSTFRLMNKGIEIPLYLGDEFKTKFEKSDFIEFYGEKNYNPNGEQNEYSDTNVYYLTWGKSTGLRWNIERNEISTMNINAPPEISIFKSSLLRKETFTYSRTAAGSEDMQDLWYWRELAAPMLDKPFSFTLSQLAKGAGLVGSLKVEFQGVSRMAANPDHYVVIGLNGQQLGEARWDGQQRYTYQNDTIPMIYFKEGQNKLEISLPGKSGDPTGQAQEVDVILLIQFEIQYWKTYCATNNVLSFTPPEWFQDTTANIDHGLKITPYLILGFTNQNIAVYDITNFRVIQPKIEKTTTNNSHQAQFNVPDEEKETKYIAITPERKKEPTRIERILFNDLSQQTTGAEYLVITHDEFYDAIQPLVQWRRQTGLTTHVVNISEVYDSFSFGLISPKAIRDFITYTYHHWKPVPKYVLLVGDASVDLRGNMNLAHARLFIPTYYWGTHMGAAASDNWYVAVGGETTNNSDTYPQMAIGRISAHSVAEVENVVHKIVQYEKKPVYGNWRQKMLFLASPDPMFTNISEELANQYVPPYFEVYRR
ncbi:MAG: C25 family cysteine peptidase, partial [bacterium]|nr:C25 family cysteine peptidase [bacterium]